MEKINRKKADITALYEISKILGSSLNLRQNLKGVMRVLSEYLDMNRGTVALRDGGEVTIIIAHGMSDEEIKRGRYKLGEGIIGQVAKHGSPIVIPNIGDEPLFLNKTGSRKIITKENIAFLCVPIKFKNEILGVLSVDRLFVKGVSFEEDLKLLKIISSLISQSVKLYHKVEQEKQALIQEKEQLRHQLKGRYNIANIIGNSDRMQEVFEAVHRVAPSKASVLLQGESGTGKELIAKAIHYMSGRAKEPFVKFNCASIPEGLLESELFGHEKGAFTGAISQRKGRFELADKGTIFLDEVGDLPLPLQPKILRVIQEREFEKVGGERTIKVDVRVIAATSRNLEELLSKGRFREDLYYRLNVVPIFLPPLRERKEDISPLTDHFLKKFNMENHKAVDITSGALDVFLHYHWPGNVRELENTIERLVVMSSGNVITPFDLPLAMRDLSMEPEHVLTAENTLISTLEKVEKTRIIEVLQQTGWIQAKAARLIGLTPRQIGYKIKKYRINLTKQ